jgi:hypothetical protein
MHRASCAIAILVSVFAYQYSFGSGSFNIIIPHQVKGTPGSGSDESLSGYMNWSIDGQYGSFDGEAVAEHVLEF